MKKVTPKKPTPKKEKITYKLDAAGQSLGRLASDIAVTLRGKKQVNFQPHILSEMEVIVSNAAKIKVTGKKLQQKNYYHFSGYPGGLKTKKMVDEFAKSPAAVLKRTVWNMLPKNKLRNEMIKNLKITN